MKFLLDTHILLWWLSGDKRLSRKVQHVFDKATAERPLHLSDISLWEIAMLHERGRVTFDRPLRNWLELAAAPPLIQLERLTPAIAADVAMLPESFHRDPADRVIVATARLLGATLITADEKISSAKLVETIS